MNTKQTNIRRKSANRAAQSAAIVLLAAAPVGAQSHTFTLDADFDSGVLAGVNHSAVSDQLQLDRTSSTFDFVWIANSQRGTLARLDAETGQVLGEYRTAPGVHGRNPSRLAIDARGNAWTGNRSESADGLGSVVQVGLVVGGTRVSKLPDGSIVPDANGLYLAPPFQHSTAVDRDGDGLIRTSRGSGNVLAWPDVTDGVGGTTGVVEDAEDECILVFQRTSAPAIHQVSVDAEGNLWAGSYPSGVFDVLDGETGALVRTVNPAGGGYGGFFDANGILWSSNPNQGQLLRYDPATGTAQFTPILLSSGLASDHQGNVWNSMWTRNTIARVESQGNVAAGFPVPTFGGGSFGVAVAPDGDVWVANSATHTVTRLAPDGSLRKRLTVSGSPNGVAIDRRGKIWVTCQLQHTAVRIDPQGGTDALGAIELVSALGSGAGPMNYGDMTRTIDVESVTPQGSWTVVHDAGRDAIAWGAISWVADVPAGTGLAVSARAGDIAADLAGLAWIDITNGADLSGSALQGRFIEMRALLSHEPGVVASPVLYELTVSGTANVAPDCAAAEASVGEIWPPDHRMVDVEILGVQDPDGDPVSITITRITQDEPLRIRGNGRCQADAEGIGSPVARVRAERAGRGNGRVYEIHFRASDGAGGECEGSVRVCVPHDRGRGRKSCCIDDGQIYESTVVAQAVSEAGPLRGRQYPNPFNPTTTIAFTLPVSSDVRLAIYDARGRELRRLLAGYRPAGEHAVVWDGRDEAGRTLPSGVYVYRVNAGDLESTGRMLLVK